MLAQAPRPERLVQVSFAPSRQQTGVLMVVVSLGETTSGTDWYIISVTVLSLSVLCTLSDRQATFCHHLGEWRGR